jgi:hypothetical protein
MQVVTKDHEKLGHEFGHLIRVSVDERTQPQNDRMSFYKQPPVLLHIFWLQLHPVPRTDEQSK